MRRHLHVADPGDLLQQPLNAILATYRPTGEVLLTPVWHEWRDGGFSAVILAEDAKDRNLQRDPRASILVAEHGGLNRGLEVRGIARRTGDEGAVVTRRITLRYLGPERTRRYMQEPEGIELVHVRLEPGELRAWDFADESWCYLEKAG
jgi:PPOX class probable F420-dependent enzyme